MTQERRSIPLLKKEWEHLEHLARETDSKASRGVSVGKPSWRRMMKRIARGELVLVAGNPGK